MKDHLISKRLYNMTIYAAIDGDAYLCDLFYTELRTRDLDLADSAVSEISAAGRRGDL